MKFKFLLSAFLVSMFILLLPQNASASEGFVELRNTTGDSARCHVSSILMQDLQYNVLVSCRDIIYPGGADIFNYIVWSTPQNGGVERLGELGLGKVLFKTKNPFTGIYVTRERDRKAAAPSTNIVMRGSVQVISFLDGSSAQTPAESELGETIVTPSPLPTVKPQSGVSRLIAAGGVIGFLGLFGVLLLVFVVTRK